METDDERRARRRAKFSVPGVAARAPSAPPPVRSDALAVIGVDALWSEHSEYVRAQDRNLGEGR